MPWLTRGALPSEAVIAERERQLMISMRALFASGADGSRPWLLNLSPSTRRTRVPGASQRISEPPVEHFGTLPHLAVPALARGVDGLDV
ncbi:MAG TPA: hypothetical protein VE959_18960 [Bryobacteraceae bacterium]|nr:hypothetical protein [Bryobacteraceae bacterium]